MASKRFQEVEKSLVSSHLLKVLTTVAYKGMSSDVKWWYIWQSPHPGGKRVPEDGSIEVLC